jgi:ATP-dependent RNA helicase DHX29
LVFQALVGLKSILIIIKALKSLHLQFHKMAPKKKKKPAANPARGFATTSLPSRVKVVEEAEQAPSNLPILTPGDVSSAANNNPQDGAKNLSQDRSLPTGTSEIGNMTPEELETYLENAELDNLLNKYATKCIAEANRQVARLETEKRQMRSQAVKLSTYGWLSEETTDQLFDMNVESNLKVKAWPSSPRDFIDDEKLLTDLWTLQRVLQALAFPTVHEAIAHVTHITVVGGFATTGDLIPGLLEAFEWYASQLQSDELLGYDQGFRRKLGETGDRTPQQDTSGE